MCLYTKDKQPRIAKRDFKVLKYLTKTGKGFQTPCQGTPVKLGKTMIPNRTTPTIQRECVDDFGNEIFSMTGGVIHAKLSESTEYGNYCAKAIVPKGAKYWIGSYGTEIAATKMIITEEEGNNKSLGEDLYKDILDSAPICNGIRLGDYQLVDGSFVHPTKRIKKTQVRGIVCGFYADNTPMICALKMFKGMWDRNWNSHIGECVSASEAKKLYNGREVTEQYKKKVKDTDKQRFEAFEICLNYRKDKVSDENWYFGSLGEVMTMLNNALYLNAAHMITGLGFLITNDDLYWSCSEYYSGYSWCCDLVSFRVCCYWCFKCCCYSFVPFYASVTEQQSNSTIK